MTSVSFVCCVESGPLEVGTVRLVESLRRFGGRYAQAPVFAVTPRFGPPLARRTYESFARLGVEYVRTASHSKYAWFKFFNKPRAVFEADQRANTDVMCWLDSDLLILGEPDALALEGVDFVASASDKEMGTCGPGDRYEPIWRSLCSTVGLEVEQLPWVKTELEDVRMRLYWNGGFFAYRRSSQFGRHYLSYVEKLLDAQVITNEPGYSTGINEMAALGLAVVKEGISFRSLPFPFNYPMSSKTPAEWYSPERLAQVKVLHYHDAMWPWFFSSFVERLQPAHAEVARWLAPLGPMKNEASPPARVWSRALRSYRDARERAYQSSCRIV